MWCHILNYCVTLFVPSQHFVSVIICLIHLSSLIYFYQGAIHFFQKLDIGSLKIGDYLGIYYIYDYLIV